MPTATEFFASKVPTPSEMTTKDWDRVRPELRERAFFMAAVTRAEVLQIFKDVTDQFIRGEISEAEARRLLREALAKTGYAPQPGEEGGIKDLRTGHRMDVVLRTNAAMAYGKGTYEKQLLAIKSYPAKRMVRLTPKRVPRDWRARFRAFEGQPGVNADKMAALITSPIWTQLSRFGLPYSPYDFGSGMGDEAVSRRDAIAMGLLDPAPSAGSASKEPVAVNSNSAGGLRIEDGDAVVKPSLNETLSVEPEVTHPGLRDALARDLEGLAKWEDSTLIFTDPNGTRPVTAEQLPEVIGTPNKAGLPLHQADAVRAWSAEGPAGMTMDSDSLYHFRRMVRRVIAMDLAEHLQLSRRFETTEARAAALAKLQPGSVWEPNTSTFPFTAFQKGTAPAASDPEMPGGANLRLIVVSHRNARDLTPAVEALADEDNHGHHVLFERGATFRVVSITQEEDGGVTVNIVETEVSP